MAKNKSNAPNDLNNNLQRILDQEGFSQAELSQKSEINATTISLICRGVQQYPRNATKTRLTKGMNKLIGAEKYKVSDIFLNGL